MAKKGSIAFSGGVDTSVNPEVVANKGFEVIAYVAKVGQDEDVSAIEKKGYATGARGLVEDLRRIGHRYIFHA
jgi:argininosuccinate synthase